MFVGQGLRIPIQAAYFVLIARSLGVQGYGAFVGVTSFVAILAPFSGLGSGSILIKHVSRDPALFSKYWGKTLYLTLISGLFLVLASFAVSKVLLPCTIPLLLILFISIADLVFTRLLDVSAQAFQAFQKLSDTSQLMVLPNLLRLIFLVSLLLFVSHPSAVLWSVLYLGSIILSSIVGIFQVNKKLGTPEFDSKIFFAEIKEGIYFSISQSSQNIYNDIDKTMLTKLATLEATGIYGAAYRIIDVSFTPVRSLLYASYARFFQNGINGLVGSLKFAKRLLPYAGGYGFVCAVMLYLLAPILPNILGNEFNEAVNALKWLSLLPLFKVFHYFAADTLTGSGFQGIRSVIQLVTAFLNVSLVIWLVPIFSWKGAVWASLASDLFLVSALWCVIWLILKRGKNGVAITNY